MLRLAVDENFNGDIVCGLLRRNPQLDMIRVQDVGRSGANDPAVLEWAATENRVAVTHDVFTLAGHAFARVAAGDSMTGVFAVPSLLAVGRAIDDLLLITECSHSGEWDGRVQFLPLQVTPFYCCEPTPLRTSAGPFVWGCHTPR